MSNTTEVERMAAVETDLKYLVKAVDKLNDRFDEWEKKAEENYVSRREFDELKNSYTWLQRTVIAAIIVSGVGYLFHLIH